MAQLELVRAKALMVKKTEEYYNSIRTNIQFSDADLKIIALTSVQPGEGKSTTSTNLAISFARAGFRTLLIDADTRNSVMTGTFVANERISGLSSYLSGNSTLTDAICTTNIENLSVIPSGKVPPNPTSLLQNSNFNHMIDTIRDIFDFVIIDTPPIGLVIDAAIISQKVDGSIIVTESGKIQRRFIKRAHEQMTQSGTRFLGVILNKVGNANDAYGEYGSYGSYGQYGQYGQYGSYGKAGKTKEKKGRKAKAKKSRRGK